MIDTRGRVAFLTGAAEGLGYDIADELARGGMRLALFDVQAEKLERRAESLVARGVTAVPYAVDLADGAATESAVRRALDELGPPRVLIHDAAVLRERTLEEVGIEDWRREVDVILQAAFILSKTVWPAMVEASGGSIVFVSSGSALTGFVKETAYTPAKHGQEGLMKVLALQGKPVNIAVNTITTGAPIDTPMSASHYTEEMRVGMVSPSRLAPAFGFLAAIDASFASGQRFNAFQLSEALTWAVTRPAALD
ncbi:MAG: SDR family NAD(P)-dependent oxidoreductase [Candidatus Dormibacteria bacterium]